MSLLAESQLNSQLGGLSAATWAQIRTACAAQPRITEVILFGSRAKGNYKAGSDIDLAIRCEAAAYETALGLSAALNEESSLPYFVDVIDLSAVSSADLLAHIARVGVTVYEK